MKKYFLALVVILIASIATGEESMFQKLSPGLTGAYYPNTGGLAFGLYAINYEVGNGFSGIYLRVYSNEKGKTKGTNLNDDAPFEWFDKQNKEIYKEFAWGGGPVLGYGKKKKLKLAPYLSLVERQEFIQYYSPVTGLYWYNGGDYESSAEIGLDVFYKINNLLGVGAGYSSLGGYSINLELDLRVELYDIF